MLIRLVAVLVCLLPAWGASDVPPKAASVRDQIHRVVIDRQRVYHVRDIELHRGDIKLYLSEGVLAFLTPVNGRSPGAVFTTVGAEAGDAEVMVLPPRKSERASLARYAKSPNLDEHLTAALLLFSDATGMELTRVINDREARPANDLSATLSEQWDRILGRITSDLDVMIVQSLLDGHKAEDGYFYVAAIGRDLGQFDIFYRPDEFEPVSVGRASPKPAGDTKFDLWTSFRPRRARPFVSVRPAIHDYQMDVRIRPDLSLDVVARFSLTARAGQGRVIPLDLSSQLTVQAGKIDGRPAEVLSRDSVRLQGGGSATFLLVADQALVDGQSYAIEVRYSGSIIQRANDGTYFVSERNGWYPHTGVTSTQFDLRFECSANLRLVATGEVLSDDVKTGIRNVHRRTAAPVRYAGFNLGEYTSIEKNENGQHIVCYANRRAPAFALPPPVVPLRRRSSLNNNPPEMTEDDPANVIAQRTAQVLQQYAKQWGALPFHTVSVTPISGYFGQGFPGLIYLSNISYLREEERPIALRDSQMKTFFSGMLLPHEAAHQWWGNVMSAADYRSDWLTEAMANYAALQILEGQDSRRAREQVLLHYRDDLMTPVDEKPLDNVGPVDFGARLIDLSDLRSWQVITYEKGTWVLEMLASRLGAVGFANLQKDLLRIGKETAVTNESFRQMASRYVPSGQPDRTLELFFETWVYGTGIPHLSVKHEGQSAVVEVSGVDDDFSATLPLRIVRADGKAVDHWMHIDSGTNTTRLPAGTKSCLLPKTSDYLYLTK